MRKQILLLLFLTTAASIILIGGALLLVTNDYLEKEAELRIEAAQDHLQGQFHIFDMLIAEDEAALENNIKLFLPRLAEQLAPWDSRFGQIPVDILNQISAQYGVDAIYLIDNSGIIVNSNFAPDLNLNLKQVSAITEQFLNQIYARGEVVSDRFNISVATGVIKKYSYYSPKGSNYIVEVSHDLIPYLSRTRSQRYVDFLFEDLFAHDVLSSSNVRQVDILIPHDIGSWSLFNADKPPSQATIKQIQDSPSGDLRISSGNITEIYKRYERVNAQRGQSPYFITKVVHDSTHYKDILFNAGMIILFVVVSIALSGLFVLSHYLRRTVINQVEAIVTNLKGVATGVYHKLEIRKPPELAKISQAINVMQERIVARESELKQSNENLEATVHKRTQDLEVANQKLEILSYIDVLTGLANRRRLDHVLRSELRRLRRRAARLSLIMLDIDFFKEYNDTLGHVAGDDCLQQIGQMLGELIRRPSDLAARYGGEEFAIILPETDAQGATTVGRNILARLSELALSHPSSPISDLITLSMGIITVNAATVNTPEEVIRLADCDLYKAKSAGRNQMCCSDFSLPGNVS